MGRTGSGTGVSVGGTGDSSGGLAACGFPPAELDLVFPACFVAGRPALRGVGGGLELHTHLLALFLK